MIKTFTVTFFLVFACSIGFTQTRETIDSLQHQLAIAKDDTSRINAQIQLCYVYRLGNTDSSLLYGQQALKSSQQINYPKGEIRALSYMSITMNQLGNLPKVLEMAFKALQIAKANHLENKAGGALNALGETYIILKDYPKAIGYLQQQKSIGINNGIEEAIAYASYDIGYAYEEMNQLDSAFFYEQQAIRSFAKISREEPLVYKTLGDIKMKSGNQAEALNYYQKSLHISIINNEPRATAYAYNKIASFYKVINQPDSAIYYARKGFDESTLIAQKKTLQEAAALLSELYEQTDTKASLHYLKIADSYKDSLFGTNNTQAIQTLVALEEEHQKEIEAAQISYRNKLKQYALFAGLGILLLIALILYRNNRQKQKTNKVLETTLSNLRSTQSQLIQSEKMASLGELTAGIAHEIQNPLNFVNNFSEVNKELLAEMKDEIDRGSTDEVKFIANDVIANEEKILHHGRRADTIVKGMLQHSRSNSGAKEPTDINVLADEYLRLCYYGFRAKDKSFNATMKTDFDESLSADEAGNGKINIVPQDIGRVILNLINNAFYAVDEKKKHMPPSPKGENEQSFLYEPIVTVSTKRLGPPLGDRGKPDGYRVEIRVADNGNGIPQKVLDKIFQPFFTTKPTGQGTGLGLSLSYDIVKAQGGEIRVETIEGKGSEFIIQLQTK